MSGSLACVGIGMTLGAHICPLAKSYIEQADVVFSGVSNGIVELWLQEMHNDVRSLQVYYSEGKSRHITYREMVDAILTEVRAGKKVVGAFYGHPGVFAHAPHKSIELARAEGFPAVMVPGISAEDCLIADLGIDPGKFGCQQFEASQFMFYKRRFDPSCYLVLWQIGLAGDKSMAKFATGAAHRQVLIELLAEQYPLEHEVILYEAAVLPIDTVRKQTLKLSELADAEIFMHTTLVIPPSQKMQPNHQVLERLAQIERQLEEEAIVGPALAGKDGTNAAVGPALAGKDGTNAPVGPDLAGKDGTNAAVGLALAGKDGTNAAVGPALAGKDGTNRPSQLKQLLHKS